MAPSTSPALAHDTACSALRPPNTTATLVFRCSLTPASAWPLPQFSPPMVVAARHPARSNAVSCACSQGKPHHRAVLAVGARPPAVTDRSEEHTSELQSRFDLVCRLLL